MDIRPIRTDEDHRAALAAIEACWGAPEGTEEGDRLDVLTALVEIYEARSARVLIRLTCSAMRSRSSATPRPSSPSFSARAHALPRFSRVAVP